MRNEMQEYHLFSYLLHLIPQGAHGIRISSRKFFAADKEFYRLKTVTRAPY